MGKRIVGSKLTGRYEMKSKGDFSIEIDLELGRQRAEKALCQRCHIRHYRKEHRRRARITVRKRRALGDLLKGPYPF